MGDHRASIKIEFKMHGVEEKVDMWINWSPDDEYRCDRRIPEWCAEVAQRARAKWEDEQWEAEREQREAATKRAELEELARLKAKYE